MYVCSSPKKAEFSETGFGIGVFYGTTTNYLPHRAGKKTLERDRLSDRINQNELCWYKSDLLVFE